MSKKRVERALSFSDGGQESDLMRIAGWRSPQMLRRYASSAAQERALAAARKVGIGNRI